MMTALALASVLTALPSTGSTSSSINPVLPREFRAAWVATVANIDYPSKPGLPTDQQQAELKRIVDASKNIGLNAIVFQIRPHGDALYKSPHEPWSYYLTGQQGRAPSPAWDPLSWLVEYAHKQGIEVHVWFNPYRANHSAQKGAQSSNHVSQTMKPYVYKYGTFEWMDPGAKQVQDHSFKVFMDVVERYDVDGIHIDDYFYPYPVRENGQEVPFPDAATYAAYQRSGGRMSRSDWRRHNVDTFIERVYKGIKQRKPWVKFGISPFGIYRPGTPAGIQAGIDQYEALSADALKWFQEGWCDYYTPQLYWPIEQTPQSFPVLLNWWNSVNTKKRHLWPGLYTSRTNPADGNWKASQVERQIGLIRAKGENMGHVHFSMKSLLNDWNGVRKAMQENVYLEPAAPPASPWLDATPPAVPTVTRSGSTYRMRSSDRDIRWYAVMTKVNDDWRVVYMGSQPTFDASRVASGTPMAFFALDRTYNSSKPAILNR